MRPPVGYDAGAMSREDREHWEAAHGTAAASPAQAEPAPFLVQHAGLLRPGRRARRRRGRGAQRRVPRRARAPRDRARRRPRGAAPRPGGRCARRVRADGPRCAGHPCGIGRHGDRDQLPRPAVVRGDRRLAAPGRDPRSGTPSCSSSARSDIPAIRHSCSRAASWSARLGSAFRVLAAREGGVEDGGRRAFRSGVVAERR